MFTQVTQRGLLVGARFEESPVRGGGAAFAEAPAAWPGGPMGWLASMRGERMEVDPPVTG